EGFSESNSCLIFQRKIFFQYMKQRLHEKRHSPLENAFLSKVAGIPEQLQATPRAASRQQLVLHADHRGEAAGDNAL
ncbi:MAG: hypothetical protein Q3X03_03070, partial [Eggerthellaceae bacterium]|nr:hypothetical protein [Eggerthellaceae bacterium]